MSFSDTSATETGVTGVFVRINEQCGHPSPGWRASPFELTGGHPGPRPVRRRG